MSLVKATFARNSIAYKLDGSQVGINQPRYGIGKFGKGLLIEEWTTNLATNPSFESGLTGWLLNGALVASVVDTDKVSGGKCLKVSSAGGSGNNYRQYVSLLPLTVYTLSVMVKVVSGLIAETLNFGLADPAWLAGALMGISDANTTGEWQRKSITFTTPAVLTSPMLYIAYSNIGIPACEVYVDDIQLEQKSYPTSFMEGWRDSEVLTFPTADVLSAVEGEFSVYFKAPNYTFTTPTYKDIIDVRLGVGSANRFIILRKTAAGQYTMYLRNGATYSVYSLTLPPDTPTMLTWSWKNGVGFSILVNGVAVASGSYTTGNYTFDNLGLYGGLGIFDDLRISSIRRTDAEVLASYNSNKPLPVDPYTTYKLDFEDTLEQTWLYLGKDWTKDDYYNADDLNKVEFNTNATAKYLTDMMYSVPLESINTDRVTTSIDFISSINRIERNIEIVKNSFLIPPEYQSSKVWSVGLGFSYLDANRLENNLQLLYTWAQIAKDNLKYCGTFNCGEEMILNA